MSATRYDPLEPSGLPLSPSMERAFLEAFADISELDDVSARNKEQSCPRSYEIDSTSLRLAMPTQVDREEMAPNMMHLATFKNATEAKRAKRSAIEKKSRQRRKNVFKCMREEVKQLENVYADMSKRMNSESSSGLSKSLGNSSGGASMDELQQKYEQLSFVALALEETGLFFDGYCKSTTVFQRYSRSVLEDRRAVWDSGVPPSLSFAAKFHRFSASECYAFVRKTYEEIQKFTECEIVESTRSSFMGWTDQHKYYRNTQTLLFAFTKQFPSENVENLFTKTWNLFLDGHQLEKMVFDSSTRTRLEVLQVLNDDLCIVRRDYRPSRLQITLTSVQIMFRLQTRTGYTFCRRTISSPEIENALEPHEHLVDTFHWVHFNRLYDEYDNPAGCEVVHVCCAGKAPL
ncbi:hypothetical protein PF007_g7447 [Phytophthora fragariae]|uniref:BZIP domain-containing protein n=2 Tax=Phytophthora fragariae TaxID=53985 RepID=A0A6A3SRV3_9STRA|nr:hypothetical protein PF007_g7447 [Phytophthora fragariae]KAE9149299.1 hypothetical protein PF006_g6191 [Phytophthora fragariae]